MGIKITTNNQWRDFTYQYDVPAKVMADTFDYHGEEEHDGYFHYKGCWYHLDMFMRIENHSDGEFSSWHGYHGDSFFSGVLIRVSDDGEQYQVATYYSTSD